MYKKRFYREWVKQRDLVTFSVKEFESDLLVCAEGDLSKEAKEALIKYRKQIEDYIRTDPLFLDTLWPYDAYPDAPEIIKDMADKSRLTGVGPMAAIAGAVAQYLGRDLLRFSRQIIIENGGDIFIKSDIERKVGIFAGKSPLSAKMAVEIKPQQTPLGICTSSGTVSHSLSFGKADAALCISESAVLADSMATAIGNRVCRKEDINSAIEFAKAVKGVEGVLVIIGKDMGVWGDIKLVDM